MKKKTWFLLAGLIGCISGITGIVFLLLGYSDVYLFSMGITGIACCTFLVLDPDNNNEERSVVKPISLLSIIAIIIMLMVTMTSCKTTGYGCKGKESWNKMVKRINNGY